jgi:CRP-like cAMP-binding protein
VDGEKNGAIAGMLATMASSGWLACCPEEFVRGIGAHATTRVYAQNEVVYRAGDPGDGVFGVISGAVLFVVDLDGRVARSAELATRGIWFGDVGAFGRSPRAATARARTKTSLLVLDNTAIEAITAERPEHWRHFATLAAINHARVLRASWHVLTSSPTARVAAKLAHLADDRAGAVPATQSELGQMTGLSRNRVNAALRELEATGAIRAGYGRIDVVEPQRLRTAVRHAASADPEKIADLPG